MSEDMAHLFADENLKSAVVGHLRLLGHDGATVQDAGLQGQDDADVLAYATTSQRAVLTFNRRHFIALHKRTAFHGGIIVCTHDDTKALADRIHQALVGRPVLISQLIRIVRPP